MPRISALRETARGRKSRAFTLTELVIVMAIIGILGVLAVFGYGRFIATSNDTVADTQAKRVATEIAAASVAHGVAPNTYKLEAFSTDGQLETLELLEISVEGRVGAFTEIVPGTGFTVAADNATKKVTVTYGGQSSCIDLSKATTVGAIPPAC